MKKRLFAVLLFAAVLCAAVCAFAADRFLFDAKSVTVFEGEELILPLVLEGSYAEGSTLKFSSNKPKVAEVNDEGVVTALSKGDATVTCTLKTAKGSTKKATIAVKVARRVNAVVLNTKKLNVYEPDDGFVAELLEQETEYPVLVIPVGKQIELGATAYPEDASNRKVSYEISDPEIATLMSSGTILKGIRAGECDFTVISKQNPEVVDCYHLLVVQPVSKLTILSDSKTVNVGSSLQLDVEYLPETATIQDVIWSTESTSIISLDEYGLVTGLKRGSATVKATAADGSGKYATLALTVQQGPESVSPKNAEETLNVGASRTLAVTVLPSTVNNKNVTWTSSDPSVASVTKGVLKGISAGTCELTCTCNADPSVSCTVSVTVLQPVSKIVFSDSSVSVDVNSYGYVSWEVQPANASNPEVTLKSSNEKIATVDRYGRVVGLKRGTCKITATAVDGSKRSASINVKVIQPVEGVYFRQDIYHVPYRGSLTLHAYTEPKDADEQGMTWYVDDTYVCTASASHTAKNAIKLKGAHLGSTVFYTTTDDGGYTASAVALVDHYNDPVQVSDIYMDNNSIKLRFMNQTRTTLTKVLFSVEVYDIQGHPLACNTKNGSNVITGSYIEPLDPGEYTVRSGFRFDNMGTPNGLIGGLILHVTGFRSDDPYTIDGVTKYYALDIPAASQVEARYPTNFKPVPLPTEAPVGN